MQEFEVLCIFLILSLLFGFCMLICSIIVAPRTKNESKEMPYECGIKIKSSNKIKFNIQFLVYAILFLIFDIETIFIFPFALSFEFLGLFVFVEIAIFLGLLLLGLIYAIKKRMLRFR